MTDALYSTRLRWSPKGRGCARLHGVSLPLAEAPVLCGAAVYAVDYTPEVRCLEIQRVPSDPPGEMSADEVAAADRLLQRLHGAAV